MPISCAICSDNIERTPQDPAALPGTACTPCGHLFHQFCIEKWLSGSLPTSKSCPLCRKQVPRAKCLPLYPDIQEATILEDSEVPRCDHGVEIHSLKKQLTDTKSQLEEVSLLQKTLTDDLERERQLLQSERRRKLHFELKYQEMKSLSTYAEELKKKNEVQEKELAALSSLQRALESIREDAEYYDDFDWPVTEHSVQTLKEQNQLLTNELKKSSNKKSNALKELKRMQEENKSLKKMMREKDEQLKTKDNEIASLKVQLKPNINDSVVIEDFSPSPLQRVTCRKRKNEEMPAKLRLDDKFPEVDDDIGVLTFGGSNKTKLDKKAKSSDDLLLEHPRAKEKPASSVATLDDDSFLSKKKKLPTRKYFEDDEDEMSPFQVKSSLVGVASKSRLTKKPVSMGSLPRVSKPAKIIYQK